uniref:Egg protein CP1084 n=1 Tax=Schistosoma japonicum TaxID=6182 RepID=C1LQ09_SCHJA|nr:Egg protein CP1084 [Schistosoma japonicum]CAX76790.1 Egg protein CP1084 [Schistosoma japonicum]
MRIIILVIISTVLLLINLLQTKSQTQSEQYETELKVEVQALLKDKKTNMRVKWNENLLDNTKPEYHNLRDEACELLLQIVRSVVPLSQDDGECKDVTFTKYVVGTKDGAVNVKLTITFKDSVAINQKPMDLKLKLENDFKNLQSESTLKATKPTFTVKVEKHLIPISKPQTTPPPTTAKNDASKKDADDNGGEESMASTVSPAITASGNEEKDEGDKDNKDSQHPDVPTSNANDRNVIIALVALMILAIVVAIMATVKQR